MRLSRRVFLRSGLGGAGGWLAAAGAPTRATAGPADDSPATLEVANPDVRQQ